MLTHVGWSAFGEPFWMNLERYTMPKPTRDELRNRFFFHPPPDQARIDAHERVSQLTFELADELNELCPAGRNHSLMLTHLEDVRMRANAALACDSPAPDVHAEGTPPPEPEPLDTETGT